MPNEFLDKRFSRDGRRIVTDERGKVYSSQDASTFFEEVTEKEVYGSPRYRENLNRPSVIQKSPVERSIELLDQLFSESFQIEQAPPARTVDRRKEARTRKYKTNREAS